ncbi:MAG: 7-carboxy-7-deazaguanine synthase QueE [Gammaproteobacteria bacterium]
MSIDPPAQALNSPVSLRITEIFYSLQGEARSVGVPTVFIRLTGCPLRCVYCDTEYAFTGGERMPLDQVLGKALSYPSKTVTVTGGEPLAQNACLTLLEALCDAGCDVSLETSGALSIEAVDSRVSIVMDLKTPSSGEMDRNLMTNLEHLQPKDQLKFVLGGREDYQWAKSVMEEHALAGRCELLFSPVHQQLAPRELADWILNDGLPVRFQMQLHKLLWGDQPGR